MSADTSADMLQLTVGGIRVLFTVVLLKKQHDPLTHRGTAKLPQEIHAGYNINPALKRCKV